MRKMMKSIAAVLAVSALMAGSAFAADKLIVKGTDGTTDMFKVTDAGAINANGNFNWDSANKRLGLGTAAPAQQLHLFQDSVSLNPTVMVDSVGDTQGVKGQFMFKRARGSVATGLLPLQNGDFMAQFALQGYNGGAVNGGYDGARRIFQIEATENWDATRGGFAYAFSTRPNGSMGIPVEAVRFNHDGVVGFSTGTSIAVSGTGKLHMHANTMRLDTPRTPASSAEACNQGDISWDANFVYVCTATNTWKRSALSAW